MYYKFRFWLSAQLLELGVLMCPDPTSRKWIRHGHWIAGDGIEKELMGDYYEQSNR